MTSATRDVGGLADELARFPADAVRRVVDGLRSAIEPELRRDTGGDGRLSGLRGGGKLRVVTSVTGDRFVEGKVTAGPRKLRGPWKWLDAGTRERVQGSGRHPGTAAKRTWSEPVDDTLPGLENELAERFASVVR